METEVVGIFKGFDNNSDLIIIDDDNDEINLDSSFFINSDKDNLLKFTNKRVSFYYINDFVYSKLFDIKEIGQDEKQVCLCHNMHQGNYMMTQRRVSEKLIQYMV